MVILKAGDYRCPYDNSSSVDLSLDFDWGAGFRTWLSNLHWSVLFPPEVLVWRQQLWQALEMPFLESTGALGAVDFQTARLHPEPQPPSSPRQRRGPAGEVRGTVNSQLARTRASRSS
jgi:hypothetical protein